MQRRRNKGKWRGKTKRSDERKSWKEKQKKERKAKEKAKQTTAKKQVTTTKRTHATTTAVCKAKRSCTNSSMSLSDSSALSLSSLTSPFEDFSTIHNRSAPRSGSPQPLSTEHHAVCFEKYSDSDYCDQIECACGQWTYEDCAVEIVLDANGKERFCPNCVL